MIYILKITVYGLLQQYQYVCIMCNAYANIAQNVITPFHFFLINVKSLR